MDGNGCAKAELTCSGELASLEVTSTNVCHFSSKIQINEGIIIPETTPNEIRLKMTCNGNKEWLTDLQPPSTVQAAKCSYADFSLPSLDVPN